MAPSREDTTARREDATPSREVTTARREDDTQQRGHESLRHQKQMKGSSPQKEAADLERLQAITRSKNA